MEQDDLFALASSLAELIGAPVTIEDLDTTVVAYSGGAQSVDEARIGTILGRRVPDRYRTLLAEAGVFERLRTEPGVVYVDLGEEQLTPRAVVAVRDGDELLGSIWAAVGSEPTAGQEAELLAAAPVVARQMVQERARLDVPRRLRTSRVRAILGGGSDAAIAADELELRGPVTVIAIAPLEPELPVTSRFVGSVDLHLNAVGPTSVVAAVDDVVYAVLCAEKQVARRILNDFLTRSPRSEELVAAIGRCVPSARDAELSRAEVDRVLSALRRSSRPGVVADVGEVLAEVVALHLSDLLGEVDAYTPLTRLHAYDEEHGAELVASTRAYLTHGGDVAAAAESLHVHPNTLRNRIRRAAQCDVDLLDGDTRMVLMLQLKLDDLR